jgi:hypothetical protein
VAALAEMVKVASLAALIGMIFSLALPVFFACFIALLAFYLLLVRMT